LHGRLNPSVSRAVGHRA